MIYKNSQYILILFLISILLSSCLGDIRNLEPVSGVQTFDESLDPKGTIEASDSGSLGSFSSSEITVVDGCIQPLEDFAYSVAPNYHKPPYSGKGPIILPPFPWQVEASMTDESLSLLVVRSVERNSEVWAGRFTFNPPMGEFMVYQANTKTWKTIPAEIEDSGVIVGELFVGPDGSLWGKNIWESKNDSAEVSLLSKFNEKTGQFEFEVGAAQIPTGNWQKDVRQNTQRPNWSQVLLDNRGIFWLFIQEDGIYSYEARTKEIKRHADISNQIIGDVALAPDGSIYYTHLNYLEHGMTLTNDDIEVFHFLPKTGEVEKVFIRLEPWPSFSNILVDDSGRLWLDSLGWREPDGTWYQIHRSPIFITNVIWSGMEYRWKTPHVLVESSDGRLWFRSDNGMVWLDPQQEQWCWFTTELSNILEDEQRNLWIVADNRLYRLELEP